LPRINYGELYFETIPIVDKRQAKVLGSGSGWEVLELLRESGIEGSTADEISDRLDLPKSTVYNILSDLSAARYVDSRRYKKGVGRPNKENIEEEKRTGKQKRIYVESISCSLRSCALGQQILQALVEIL
jgi:DNA-binding transcriptional ArsR family regulator